MYHNKKVKGDRQLTQWNYIPTLKKNMHKEEENDMTKDEILHYISQVKCQKHTAKKQDCKQ